MGNGCSTGRLPNTDGPLAPDLPSLKIALVGDPGVGKTSVLLRYIRNQFSPMYIPTKKVAIENVVRKLNVPAHTVVSLTFWDIPSMEDMDVHRSYFRNLDAAIVVVDLTKDVTMNMANVWKQTVLNKLTRTLPVNNNNNNFGDGDQEVKEIPVDPINFPVLLLGNKFDIIEEEMYAALANKKTSVSMDVTSEEEELSHPTIVRLQEVADQHNFIGSLMVSAKQTDNSVSMAIQALVRNILEKMKIPRKWKPVQPKPKKPKKDIPFVYDKLEKVDMEKFDVVIAKADGLVKQVVILRHYYTVAMERFRHTCTTGEITTKDKTSLEDCIYGLKQGTKQGSIMKVSEDEGFVKLEVENEDEEETVKQTKPWKKAYRCFHNEYAAVSKAILKEGPSIQKALQSFDIAMEKMQKENASLQESFNHNVPEIKKQEMIEVANKTLRNRAKLQRAKEEMEQAEQDVKTAAGKVFNADRW